MAIATARQAVRAANGDQPSVHFHAEKHSALKVCPVADKLPLLLEGPIEFTGHEGQELSLSVSLGKKLDDARRVGLNDSAQHGRAGVAEYE